MDAESRIPSEIIIDDDQEIDQINHHNRLKSVNSSIKSNYNHRQQSTRIRRNHPDSFRTRKSCGSNSSNFDKLLRRRCCSWCCSASKNLITTRSSSCYTPNLSSHLSSSLLLSFRNRNCSNMLLIISLIFLIFIALTSHVSCLGIFELRLDKFVNELNRDASGRCCSPAPSSSSSNQVETNQTNSLPLTAQNDPITTLIKNQTKCEEKCQTFFRVCFKNYQANIDTSSNCLYGEVVTPILLPHIKNHQAHHHKHHPHHHSSSSSSSDNQQQQHYDSDDDGDNYYYYNYTIKFPFNFTWPGTFSLIIEVWNNSTMLNHQIDNTGAPATTTTTTTITTNQQNLKHRTPSLIARSFESRRDALAVGKEWTRRTKYINNNQTILQYSYRIQCNDNYYGNSCTIKCTPRNDLYGHYTCGQNGEKICHQGWTNEYCDKPICRSCNETNGNCISPDQCQCRMGWTGEDCTQCLQYPNCKHGYCNVAMECICKEGWGGLLCDKDLNYCTNNQPCKNGGLCSNTGESFTCQCPPGFSGEYCEKEIDSCDHFPCLNGGTCKSNAVSNYTCECPIGYDGRHCEHLLSACSNNPCENEGTCIDGPSGFLCACKLGYSGSKCQIKQKGCSPNPCHGGSCVPLNENIVGNSTGETYTCQCRPGFTGDHCEIDINDCESDPCLNSGTCIDEIDSFRCRCPPGFKGELCEVNFDECSTKPCANSATCVDRNNDYLCICPPGFTGKDCSINIDDCASEPCFNGGYCRDRINSFECLCLPNFSGPRCEFADENILLENSSSPIWAEKKSQADFDLVSTGQFSIIILIASGLALIIILISVCVIVCKQVKNQGIKLKRRRDEAEAQRQNEHNAIMNSMNNKYLDQCLNRSAANVIVNTLNRPASLHQLNKCHKATNEYVFSGQFNKCHTLQNSYNNNNNHHHPNHHHKSINKEKLTNSEHSIKMSLQDDSSPYLHHTYEQISSNIHIGAAGKTKNLLSSNHQPAPPLPPPPPLYHPHHQQQQLQYSQKQSNLDIYSKIVPQVNNNNNNQHHHKSDYMPVMPNTNINYFGDNNNSYAIIHDDNYLIKSSNLQRNCRSNSIYVINNNNTNEEQPIYNNNNNDPIKNKLQATEV